MTEACQEHLNCFELITLSLIKLLISVNVWPAMQSVSSICELDVKLVVSERSPQPQHAEKSQHPLASE